MAGLFASAGMGPYNATKFAVVAISETLSKELQAAGSSVGVSVLCPGFVRTNIFDSQRNRPDALRNATKAVGDARARNDILKRFLEIAMEPAEVAVHVRDAIVEDRFWVTTHPEFFNAVTQRADDIVSGRNPIPSTFESQSD
jgi:NAD(P)-dependent dehydrogenase (short-subunit alcohol dehydrogenase family)